MQIPITTGNVGFSPCFQLHSSILIQLSFKSTLSSWNIKEQNMGHVSKTIIAVL